MVIDLASRRRLRLNGKVQKQLNGSVCVQIQQVYFNCPKYIQARTVQARETQLTLTRSSQQYHSLCSEAQQWIASADTFFIASFHPESGADASHRGGYPGFVRCLNADQILFPDYIGNNMFNTLGNICANPRVGLLFLDFEHGSTLQVIGTARILWDSEYQLDFPGAQRLVEVQVETAILTSDATPLRWQFGDYSPFNPPITES